MVTEMTCYTYLGHITIRNPRIYAAPQLRGFYAILLSSQKPRKMGGILYKYNRWDPVSFIVSVHANTKPYMPSLT